MWFREDTVRGAYGCDVLPGAGKVYNDADGVCTGDDPNLVAEIVCIDAEGFVIA